MVFQLFIFSQRCRFDKSVWERSLPQISVSEINYGALTKISLLKLLEAVIQIIYKIWNSLKLFASKIITSAI